MMRRKLARAHWLLVASLLLPTPALAQTAGKLAEAERAYAEVDFERTRTLARAALTQGSNDRSATARLYLLLATAAAALDQTDEAKLAFRHVLAMDPQLKLDKTLSPKIRAPYLEARGSLGLEEGKPPLEVSLLRKQNELELTLKDALDVAEKVELASRVAPAEFFTRRHLEPRGAQRVPAPAAGELQYFVRVTDAHDNVLLELGTEDEPQRLVLVSQPAPAGAAPSPVKDVNPTPYYATAATLAVLGLASGTGSAIMYMRREDAAEEWNGSGCEQPGATRAEQCGDVDDRRKRAEYLAIGLGAASGALLVGSVITLLLAPSSKSSAPAVTVAAGPQHVAITLGSSL